MDDHDLYLVQDSDEDNSARQTRRSKKKTGERIAWVGKPVYTEEDNKFYHAVSVDNSTYYLKEYISVPITVSARRNPRRGARGEKDKSESLSAHTMVIGKIERLWETKAGELMCQLNHLWVAPEDAPGGRRPYHGSKELVPKEELHQLCRPLQLLFPDILKHSIKVVVESFEDFSRRKHFPDNVYYVQSEELLEPKIENGSPARRHEESKATEDRHLKTKRTKKSDHIEDAEEPEPELEPHGSRTPPRGLDMDVDNVATPSPSQRKNRRVISDEGDYVAVKKENSQQEDGEVRPLRRLKRMKDLEEKEELDEEENDSEPNLEDLVSTPRKRKRIITDSDAENEVFFEQEANQGTRRSTRIPELQQRRQDKLRSIMTHESDHDASDSLESIHGTTTIEDPTPMNDESDDSTADKKTAQDSGGSDSDVVDITNRGLPTKTNPKQSKSSRKRDMSWIELSEQGKLAVPATKPLLQFDTPNTTEPPSRLRNSRKAHQANITSFLSERRTTPFVNLVDADENENAEGNSEKLRKKKKQTKNSSEEQTKRSRKEKKHSYGNAFIPQLMFNDNDVDDDINQHLKQQRLLHEFSRHSTTNQDEDEGRGRWGKSAKRKANPVEEEESEPEGNDSGYESDDFLVADDAPIETYAPSQDELHDDEEASNEEEASEDEFSKDIKNDQDGLFEHVFTNKQAFIVFLQYVISACVDPDFIPMMVDAESTDTYFKPALRKIRDQIQSRKTSLVQSSAWDATFKEDLETRPYLASYPTQNINLDDCQACLRANHPASYKACMSGPRYNPTQYLTSNNVLDLPILPDEENDDRDEDTYLLGRFCHARTSLYHRLHFFHVHTFEKIKKKVQKEQDSTPSLSEELVQALLNNSSWITEMTDRFSNLLMEADTFMNDSNEIM